ncbi:MAG: hypothetical protein WCB00_03150, partial [Candidatus Acidiferrales bacterium]
GLFSAAPTALGFAAAKERPESRGRLAIRLSNLWTNLGTRDLQGQSQQRAQQAAPLKIQRRGLAGETSE